MLIYDPTTRVVTLDRTRAAVDADVPQADVFMVKPPAGAMPVTMRFWLTVPKTSPGPAARAIVIVQHGLTSWRGDMFSLGEDFAKGGAARVGFDIDFHGARTRCATAADCAPASTTDDPAACVLAAFSGDTDERLQAGCVGQGLRRSLQPVRRAPGGWQYVVDAAQLCA